ncbi:hypothetical protein [Eisenbergiella tayi]|uniref:hypothetical protein n=1 Tax=Eisenbergiella tayi TaxID=1432052 RepID=UPI00242FFEBD|nr:hypothetical protein [Eisenbergiella tayi]MDT4532773.1 hypothetical protein [Eisenbergiella tayi]
MKRLARKKIVLVIVEGPSDEVALGMALSQVYDKDFIYVHIMHGDITARRGVSSKNIVAKLGNEVTAYAKSQHYKASDFKQIIHIVDTDGAYIPDDNIMEKENYLDIRYENDGIYTNNKASVMTRNQQKRDNLYRLRSCGIIWTIPYSLYYMSCNLDHVLYDKKNSTDKDKENDAYVFAKKYKGKVESFKEFICKSPFSVTGDYKGSWDYIEKDLNSVNRYTNLCICIENELESRMMS